MTSGGHLLRKDTENDRRNPKELEENLEKNIKSHMTFADIVAKLIWLLQYFGNYDGVLIPAADCCLMKNRRCLSAGIMCFMWTLWSFRITPEALHEKARADVPVCQQRQPVFPLGAAPTTAYNKLRSRRLAPDVPENLIGDIIDNILAKMENYQVLWIIYSLYLMNG